MMRKVFTILAVAACCGVLYGSLSPGPMDLLRLKYVLATTVDETKPDEPKQIDPVALARRGCTPEDIRFQRQEWFLLSRDYEEQRRETDRMLAAAHLFWMLARDRGLDLEKLNKTVPLPEGLGLEELLAQMVRLSLVREQMLHASEKHLKLFGKSREREEHILEKMRRFPTCT